MVPWRRKGSIFTRLHLMIHIAHIQQVKHPQICWLNLTWTHTNSYQMLRIAAIIMDHFNFQKLIPLIINNALQGRSLPVYGDGKNVRDWLYVEDHAERN